MKLYILILSLIISSCALQDSSQIPTFPYVFSESTGITSAIIINGKKINIKFSNDSDLVALKALTSLEWFVLYPNGDGEHIFLEGYLDNKIHWTPSSPTMAQAESYQEMKLVNWYIKTPFKRINLKNELLPDKHEIVLGHKLKESDFKFSQENEFIELMRFQKTFP